MYHLKRNISLKIFDVLKRYAVKNDENLAEKIQHCAKINRVDKSSKIFALLTLDLKSLSSDLNLNDFKSLDFKSDDYIESIKLDRNKLLVQANQHLFKKEVVENIFRHKFNYGFENPNSKSGKTIIEFSSPNIAKPLHAGHMRSTFLGNFLSNIHQKLGHDVTKINYLGDWGTQYGILAVGFKKFGSYAELEQSPIKHLLDVYVKANQDESVKSKALEYFSKMEQKDPESLKMWTLFKELSIKELETVYEKLNIKFDVYESESEYYELARDYVKKLLEIGLAEQLNNNVVQAKIKSYEKKFIVQKSDGSTLYITRDIAALCERKKKYKFDKIVYVVDSSQKDHFVKLYKCVKSLDEKILGDLSFEKFFVPFGRITNMSTRKGKVEFLSDLINEAKIVAHESMEFSKTKRELDNAEHVAQIIGNSHLIITDLAKPRLKDYEFSWKNIVAKDDSAYMCHYAHARLFSLLNKCERELKLIPDIENTDLNLLNKQNELVLIQHLARFEEAVWQAYQEYEPYHVVQYLFQLVRLTNICLKDNYVLNENENLAKARLLLYSCSKQVIQNSFNILGIQSLNSV